MPTPRKSKTPETPVTAPAQTPDATVPAPRKATPLPEVAFEIGSTDAFNFQSPPRKGRPRSDYQQSVDTLVRDSYGKPSAHVIVDATVEAVEAMQKRLRSAGAFLKLGVRIGLPQPVPGQPGKAAVVFKVVEQIKKPRAPKTNEQ